MVRTADTRRSRPTTTAAGAAPASRASTDRRRAIDGLTGARLNAEACRPGVVALHRFRSDRRGLASRIVDLTQEVAPMMFRLALLAAAALSTLAPALRAQEPAAQAEQARAVAAERVARNYHVRVASQI